MDTTTPAGRAFLQIQAAFAEMERNVIRQRVREGVKAARARGRKGGTAGSENLVAAAQVQSRSRIERLEATCAGLGYTHGKSAVPAAHGQHDE